MKSGRPHAAGFSRALEAAPADAEIAARPKLHEEPEQDIRVLGELVRDVGAMMDMLKGLAFSGPDEYRRNLRVVRGAAERTITRCDRLIGDDAAG